jgi:hypothetical protein
MKKIILIVALMAAALVGSVLAETPLPAAVPQKTAGPTCKLYSRTPELYTFYGDKNTIVKQLAKIPANLSERRMFLQITQGVSRTDVELYEQQDNGKFKKTNWNTQKTTFALVSKIDHTIIANAGEHCVGAQIKALLNTELGVKPDTTPVPVENSPQAAFDDSVLNIPGTPTDFIKTTLIILC